MLGVSGGPDSMCMAHLFLHFCREYKLDLTIAHFNHALRKESDGEEKFVQEYARQNGIRCVSQKKEIAEADIDSLEQTARLYRFHFFCEKARVLKIRKLALAHNQDDLAETVLMRLLRGSGLLGLSGFGAVSKYKRLTVVRPLIELPKSEIIAFLAKERIAYCTDSSNFQTHFLRNKLRLQLVPLLEKEYNPSIKSVLATVAKTVAADYDYLVAQAREEYSRLRTKEAHQAVSFDIPAFKRLHVSMQYMVLRLGLEEVRGDLRRIEYKHLEDTLLLIDDLAPLGALDLPSVVVEKYKGIIRIKGSVRTSPSFS